MKSRGEIFFSVKCMGKSAKEDEEIAAEEKSSKESPQEGQQAPNCYQEGQETGLKAGKVSGFFDSGAYTPEEQKQLPCDHGLVVMFVPLIGSWSQILGTLATCTNIKRELLAKIVLEATILAGKAGLFLNYVTSDAATWNRNMWRMMGVKANSKEVIAKRVNPSDDKGSLYFLLDFPHLVKNIRNRLLQTSFHTPDGKEDEVSHHNYDNALSGGSVEAQLSGCTRPRRILGIPHKMGTDC
ncbi:hypothetical protein HPB51_023545 [Rhipicephalus microplus]|uniref:Transposable element P transposase-like RNase H domain-containing protein n=1 Tax=Rhipicephalus microplus TaxID=6941 RepID=A0A9J6E491_RHIMP|nr:hypothetical protein HPB51_023545 [Rhipicephalus microplus]